MAEAAAAFGTGAAALGVLNTIVRSASVLWRGEKAAQELESVVSLASDLDDKFLTHAPHFSPFALQKTKQHQEKVRDAVDRIRKPPQQRNPSTSVLAKLKYKVSLSWYGIRHGNSVLSKLKSVRRDLLPSYGEAIISEANTRQGFHSSEQSNAVGVGTMLQGLGRATRMIKSVENWRNGTAPSVPAPKLCFLGLVGHGGLGKTTLLHHIVHKLEHEKWFDRVAQVDLSDSLSGEDLKRRQKSLINALLQGKAKYEVPSKLNLGKTKLKAVFEDLAKCGNSVCITIDDVWTLKDLQDLLPEMNVPLFSCCIIITSRVQGIVDGLKQHCAADRGACHIETFQLEPLTSEDSRELLLSRAKANDQGSNSTSDAELSELVERIYPRCYNLPIALNLAGAQLAKRRDTSFWEEWILAMAEDMPGLAGDLEFHMGHILGKVYSKLSGESQLVVCGIAACFHEWSERIAIHTVGEIDIDSIRKYSLIPVENSLRMHAIIRKLACYYARSRDDIRWGLQGKWSKSELCSREYRNVKYLLLDVRNAGGFCDDLIIEEICFECMEELCVLDMLGPFQWKGLLRFPKSLRYLRLQDNKCLRKVFANTMSLSTSQQPEQGLVDASDWTMLKVLWLEKCSNITQLPVEALGSLKELILNGCTCLEESKDEWGRRLSHVCIVINKVAFACSPGPSSSSSVSPAKGIPRATASTEENSSSHISVTDTTISKIVGYSREQLCSLKMLAISKCNEPEQTWAPSVEMKSLKLLELEDCGWIKLHPALFNMTRHLTKLRLKRCHQLIALPESLGELEVLQELTVNWCHKLEELPEAVERLQCLRILDLNGCGNFRRLPENITKLTCLEEMSLDSCGSLQLLPQVMTNLKSLRILRLSWCKSITQCLLHSLDTLDHQLEILDLSGLDSEQLKNIPCTISKVIRM